MAVMSKCVFGIRVHIAMAVQFALVFQPKYYAHINEDGLHQWLKPMLNFTLECVRYQVGIPDLRMEEVWLGGGLRGLFWVVPNRYLPANITPEDDILLKWFLRVSGIAEGPNLFVSGNEPEPKSFQRWHDVPNYLKTSTVDYFLWDLAAGNFSIGSLMKSFTLELGEIVSITYDINEASEKYYGNYTSASGHYISEPTHYEAPNPDIFCAESPYYHGYIVNFLQATQCAIVHEPMLQSEVEKEGFNVACPAMLRSAVHVMRRESGISDLCIQLVWIGHDHVAFCWVLPKRFRPGYRTTTENSVLEHLKSILGIQEQPSTYFSAKVPEPEYLQEISERVDQSSYEYCVKGFRSGAPSVALLMTSFKFEKLNEHEYEVFRSV